VRYFLHHRNTDLLLLNCSANINLSKLDSAFDIDPLFSKMSKAFDEGGAKGLLLVNLGVSSNGCNIVFDSKAEADFDEEANSDNDHNAGDDKLIDISILIDKLKEQTATEDARDMLAALEDLPLVPQLSELRAEHAVLDSQGFAVGDRTDDTGMERKRGHYFRVSEEEEKEADRSIHQDALERSRASQGRPSFLGSEAGEEMSYGDDNVFAGDNDDDDDFGGDGMFLNVTPQRASSFSGNSVIETDYETRTQNKATSNFLDMLSNTHDFWSTDDDTQFFKPDLFASQGQNHWAGVSHWNAGKKQVGNKTATKEKNTNAPRSERKTRKKPMVDFSTPPQNFDFEIGEGLTWSGATIAKHSRNENVLPLDAGILSLKQLQSLFLRPTLTILSKDQSRSKKAVGFVDTDDWDTGGGFDDGDDDDGPGFFISSNDDEVTKEDDDFIRELEGVRKVEKVQVGYATIAKKVDVKKLKTDLWKELELKFSVTKKGDDAIDGDDSEDEIMAEQSPTVLSFKEAVQNMEARKSQSDVTLPFYFICILHLANEKGLRLVDKGLDEFEIIHEGLKSSSNF
jgi:condensin complex subunit 2